MNRYSGIAVASIVTLRLVIGFHFFSEGQAKLKDPKPFSAMFLGAAKGPLASLYRSRVWDADGEARFDQSQTEQAWANFVARAKRHFGFDETQNEQADQALARRSELLAGYLGSIAEERDEYNKGLKYLREADRQDRPDDKRVRVGVASLKGQWDKTENELKAKRSAWLGNLDKLAKDLERDLNQLATSDQARRGLLSVDKPGRRFLDSEAVDKIIPYFDLIVGALLVLGFCTRSAAIAGALFLASVVASQWPGTPGAISTSYQAIEMLALVVLAAFGAGQFASFDFLINNFCGNCCGRKQACESKLPKS